jgi:hypothetical protein
LPVYQRVLDMRPVTFSSGRRALTSGRHKLSLHQAGREPKTAQPTPGSADLFLISATPLLEVPAHLERCGVALAAGPVARSGALGPIASASFRDPDGNLVEIPVQGPT